MVPERSAVIRTFKGPALYESVEKNDTDDEARSTPHFLVCLCLALPCFIGVATSSGRLHTARQGRSELWQP